jgi:hypothetical protein
VARFFGNGTADYVAGTVATMGGAGTIAFRAKLRWVSGDSVWRTFFSIDDGGGNNNLKIYRYSDNSLYIDFYALGTNYQIGVSDAGIFTAGAFNSYFLTWNNATPLRKFYLNTAEKLSSSVTFSVPSSTPIYIGNNTAGASSLSAYADIEDWAKWNVELDAKSRAEYVAGKSPLLIRPASLTDYFPITGKTERNVKTGGVATPTGTLPAAGSARPIIINFDAGIISGGTITGDGAAAGTGTATATGAATAAGTASAAGTGAAMGVGAATAAGVGNAAGSGVATGVGASTAIVAGVGAADGTSTAAAVGAATGIISAVGNAAGSSTALGVALTTGAGGAPGRAGARRKRRRRIDELPPDLRHLLPPEIREPESPEAPAPEAVQPPVSVKLSKAERKLAQAVARARSADPATAERARAFLDAIRANADSDLARLLARHQMLDEQRRLAAAASAAEDDDAVVAFLTWMLRQ